MLCHKDEFTTVLRKQKALFKQISKAPSVILVLGHWIDIVTPHPMRLGMQWHYNI